MARIQLADGREIPVVKANLWDAAAVQKEMGWKAKQYQAEIQLVGMQQALMIFASLNRAGVKVTFRACADLDDIESLLADESDNVRAADEESEGEQSTDPQNAGTSAHDGAIA